MSKIQLNWSTDIESTDSSTLLLNTPKLSGSISDDIDNRIVYTTMYLRNNGSLDGSSTAYNLGFYLNPYGNEHSKDFNFQNILQWSQLQDEDDKPYGAFTVFGYNSTGSVSYIDSYISNTITANELRLFQHNWLQGSNSINTIKLDSAYRYIDETYVQSTNFEVFNSSLSNANGEKSGLVKVLFGVRIPHSIDPVRILVNHNIHYEELI